MCHSITRSGYSVYSVVSHFWMAIFERKWENIHQNYFFSSRWWKNRIFIIFFGIKFSLLFHFGNKLENDGKNSHFASKKKNVFFSLVFLWVQLLLFDWQGKGVCLRRLMFFSPSADSSDIVDGKLKLILGLIWTLILHYSISMPMWADEDESAKDLSPKQRLLRWIQNKIPDLPINNFTSDWNDGRAVGALVDAVAPGTDHQSFMYRLNLLRTKNFRRTSDPQVWLVCVCPGQVSAPTGRTGRRRMPKRYTFLTRFFEFHVQNLSSSLERHGSHETGRRLARYVPVTR